MKKEILNLLRSNDEEMQRLGLLALGYKETRESANEINGELIEHNLQMRWSNLMETRKASYDINQFIISNHYHRIVFTNEDRVVVVPAGHDIPEVWK